MRKQEAFTLLGLEENAPKQAIVQKYQSLFSDYQMRLTNAPTPNLKKLYQKNLQELEQAKTVLLSGGVLDTGDLPSSTPSFKKEQVTPRNQQSSFNSFNQNTTQRKAPAKQEKTNTFPGWAILLAIAAVSLASLFGILWFQAKQAIVEKEKEIAALQHLIPLDEALKNQKNKIQNAGIKDLVVTSVNMVYRGKDNTFKKMEFFANKLLRANGSITLERVVGDDILWNGDVVFYSFDCKYQGEYFHVAGHWLTDAPDGILKINLD